MKKRSSGKIKKPSLAKKLNPFELKYNRAKHKILGTKAASAPCGAPGLSKKKAFENRAKTLAVEWRERGKRNKIVDQRLLERNTTAAADDRISKRFAAERLKFFKTNNPELAENGEEQLTHKGRALTEIEKYDRAMPSDEDDDNEEGNIGADVVATAHFGGGTISDTETAASKRRDILADLIEKTKQQRFDKKMARDELEDATERLDEKWKEILQTGAMGNFARTVKDKSVINSGKDDYDNLLFELQTDRGKRGEASERQKTEEELAHEEREKLIKQEKARLARLNENDAEENKKRRKDDESKEESFMVKYDSSGALVNAEKVKRGQIKVVRINSDSSDEEASATDELSEEEDDFDAMGQEDGIESEENADSESVKVRKNMEKGELPFLIEMPQKYENLKKLLDDHSAPDCEVIITRLIRLYHPSLREGNKLRLSRLFILLLRYYDDLSKEDAARINSFGYIARSLYALMKFNIEYSARCMRALLRQQYSLHLRTPREMFTFRALAFLKLVSRLYPTSDAFHPVVSPTIAFACRLISTVRICDVKDAARALLLVRILSSFVEYSKRFLPEVIAFLHGVFLMAVENANNERTPTATFPISLPHRRMLFITSDCTTTEIPSQLDAAEVFSCSSDSPLMSMLARLPRDRYPEQLVGELSAFETFVNAQSSKISLKQLQRSKKEKRMLEMLEPRFEEGFDVEKAHYQKNSAKNSRKTEIKQLTKKYKKELRSTVRELRRDNQFLNREKRQEISENDRARRRKTKLLISTLQGQESEYKKNANLKHKL